MFLVEADQVDTCDAAEPDRIDGLGHAVAADVLGEMVEGSAGKDRKGKAGFDGDARSARDGAIAAADREHLGALCGVAQHRHDVVVLADLDDLRGRQCVAHFVDDTRPGTAARRRIDHQHHARTVGPRGSFHPQWIGGGDLGGDDRRHDSAAEHCDARTDAEAGEHVARIVRTHGDPGQPDQPGKQRQPQPDGRVLQSNADRECGGAGGVSGRQ